MDSFQLPSQDTGEVGRLAPHGILVNGDKLLERLDGEGFREILYHPEDALVEGRVDLAGVLNVLETRKK